jgi:hypothetical protein
MPGSYLISVSYTVAKRKPSCYTEHERDSSVYQNRRGIRGLFIIAVLRGFIGETLRKYSSRYAKPKFISISGL